MSRSKVMFSFRNMKDERASKFNKNDEDHSEMEDEDEFYDEFSSWRSELIASAFIESKVPGEKPKEIASGVGYIVNRPSIRGDWWGLMDGPDEEFQEFSTVLFDKRGYFRKELYEHPTKKGTGVFGPELGQGKLLYIQCIRVEANYRRQGIGKKLVEGLQALAEQKGVSLAFCWPTTLDRDDEEDVPVSFMRSAGYRRVGLTNFLCRSSDASHPSRLLAIALDAEKPDNPWKNLSPDEIQKKFPLHSMIINLPPKSLLDKLRSLPSDTDWRAKDFNQESLLHMAAEKRVPEVVEFLLSKPGVRDDVTVTNADGHTPLQKLVTDEQSCRGFVDSMTSMPELWTGFSDQSMQTMKLLTEAMGGIWNDDIEKRARFGCTCGQCVEGYISPRMNFELLGQAKGQRADILQGSTPVDDEEPEPVILDYFPRNVPKKTREHVDFKNGVCTILDSIGSCLLDGRLPSLENVQRQTQTDPSALAALSRFFKMGGTIEDTFRAFFKLTKEQNIEQGDGMFYLAFENEILTLPVCENDDRVSFVRAMLLDEASRAGFLTETEKQRNTETLMASLSARSFSSPSFAL